MSQDPTYVPVLDTNSTDPFVRRMVGEAYHPIPFGTKFDVPYISEILPGFYQGGCRTGLILPDAIEHVVSLYKWEKYKRHANVKTFHEVTMYDAEDEPDYDNIVELATLVNECRAQGPTLVHCQAGLNRSGLVAGMALMLDGNSADEAIHILRSSRSPAVLCNPVFADWLRSL